MRPFTQAVSKCESPSPLRFLAEWGGALLKTEMKWRGSSLLFLAFVLLGCVSTGFHGEDVPKVYLGDPPDSENIKSFRKLVKMEPGTEVFEKARIDYLFERLSKSPYNFMRNGKTYSNERAVVHLRWKQFRNKRLCKTAESFVDFVASCSKVSGQPYLIKINDSEFHLVKEVFYNELELLEQARLRYIEEVRQREEERQKEAEKEGGKEAEVESPEERNFNETKEIMPNAETQTGKNPTTI